MYKKMTFWGVCMALAMVVGAPAVAADRVIGNIIVPIPSNGTNGAAGADGASAYQIWLNAGNTGTEADFLASLVGAPGTNGVDGAPGAACESTLTTTQCGPDLTQKCPVATKSGVIYTKTDCNNANPTQDVVYNGTDGATGAAGAACQSTITSTVCGPNETVQCAESGKNGVRIAKTDCNNENPTYDYVYNGNDGANGTNGNDGVGVCDGITSANLNKTVKNTTSVYTAATSSAAGYLTNTRTMCDETTVATDTVQDTCMQIVDTRTSGACDGAYLMCTNQTTNATYYVCKAISGTNVSSISSAINTAQSTADNATSAAQTAQQTANGKVDTTTFTTYQSSVTTALSGKADSSDLTTANGKITALETTVGDATSGLVKQVAANTNDLSNKLDSSAAASTYLTQTNASNTYATKTALGTVESTANTAASNASSALSTANTASSNASTALTNTQTLNTTVYGAADGSETASGLTTIVGKTASSGLRGTVATNTSNITSLQTRASNLETTVNGNGTAANPGLASELATLKSQYSALSSDYSALVTRVEAMERCSSCAAPSADN